MRASRLAVLIGPLALLGAVLLAAGCRPSAPEPPRNVVLVVVDTLRWDRLGVYGANRDTSPSLDAFAAGAVRFERAYATAPWTKPSVASMVTGLHPSTHGGQTVDLPLPEEAETLAEILQAHGYATVGIVSNFVVSRKNGFAQGFDEYDQGQARDFNHVSSGRVSDKAIAALEALAAGEAPFFLFVHYFDPHYNYVHHPDVGFAKPSVERLDGSHSIDALRHIRDLSKAEVAQLRALYDEEVRHTDEGIGRLLDQLRALGIEQETLVVATSDHGEELLERGWLGHTRTLYEELIRVPLMVRVPGLAPRVVRSPVSLVSLTPTILELAGIDTGQRHFQGPSLAPHLSGAAPDEAPAWLLAEVDFHSKRKQEKTAFKKSLVGARYKLIRDDRSGVIELYDLQTDPLERRNLAGQRRDLVDTLLPILEQRLRDAAQRRLEAPAIELDAAELELLRGLGYVEPAEGGP